MDDHKAVAPGAVTHVDVHRHRTPIGCDLNADSFKNNLIGGTGHNNGVRSVAILAAGQARQFLKARGIRGSKATVYRTLPLLAEAGILQPAIVASSRCSTSSSPASGRRISATATAIACIQGCIILVAGFFLGLRISVPVFFGMLGVMLVAGLTFASMGLFLATVSRNSSTFQIAVSVVAMPLTFLSGAYIPVTVIPKFLSWVMYLNPLTHITAMFRYVTLGLYAAPVAELVRDAPIALQRAATLIRMRRRDRRGRCAHQPLNRQRRAVRAHWQHRPVD